jgi:hypothetical protein
MNAGIALAMASGAMASPSKSLKKFEATPPTTQLSPDLERIASKGSMRFSDNDLQPQEGNLDLV